MLGVALVAVCLKWPILAAPAVLLGGAGAVGRVWGPGPGRAAAAVLVAVYAPTIQGFFLDCEHCRNVWRWIAPVLPGGIVAELLRALTGLRMPSDASSYGLAAALTLILLGGLIWLAARGRAWLVAVAVACGAGSAFASFAVGQALRM
jgi:hypothetical protein